MDSVLNYNLLSRQSPLAYSMMANRNRDRKVVFYGRVSTEHEAQLAALENQLQWYDDQARYHQNWNVLDKYIDEGITGTQAKKRPSFLRMIEDAKNHKFDLIVTREVCRFARNTVDTLVVTRELKNYGIEVYFVEDNIWTMDGDGELRLTIMATLAQEESRKTSERVKAGQKISRDNGVLYGNGNILGYDRVGNTYVINEDQAETVRMIFDLYDQGHGMMQISKILTERKRKNSNGEVKWATSKISRMLHNSTYKGYQAYLKSFSNNFLEQKRINNHNESTYMYVKGDYPAIICEEQWERVQRKMAEKRVDKPHPDGKRLSYGKKATSDRWLKKLKCSCGSGYRKNLWHRTKSGRETFGYQCYNQLNNGTKQMNEEFGLPTDGKCANRMITDWKLDCMASEIFNSLAIDKKELVLDIFRILNDCSCGAINEKQRDVSSQNRQLEKAKTKLRNLINMRMEGEIEKEDFAEMKATIEKEIKIISEKLSKVNSNDGDNNVQLYDEAAVAACLEELASFSPDKLDKEFADRFVYQIIQLGDDHFAWVLNLDGSKKETIVAKIRGRKGNNKVEIVRNGDFGTDVGSTTNKSQILGGENKKDDSDEDFSSTESSNCTYKSINIGHFFVQSELVDLFQCSLSSSKTSYRNTEG